MHIIVCIQVVTYIYIYNALQIFLNNLIELENKTKKGAGRQCVELWEWELSFDFCRCGFFMSNNPAIMLLRLDLSNKAIFEPMNPFKLTYVMPIKLRFDSMMTLLICVWPQVTNFTLQSQIPVQGEKKRQDLTATPPRERPKLQALTPWDWVIMSVLAQTWGCSRYKLGTLVVPIRFSVSLCIYLTLIQTHV